MRQRAFGALLLALACAGGGDVAAQDRHTVSESRLDSIVRRVESMVPSSGAPGTRVTLRSTNMPAITPVRIGVGAVRFGFEEIAQILTNEKGEFSLDVTVPAWARRDLTHRFIVFDFYFVPIALSDVFYVTDTNGTLAREGEVVRVEPSCSVVRADDGLLYALVRQGTGLAIGSRVVVEGKLAESSACTQGIALDVVRITTRTR